MCGYHVWVGDDAGQRHCNRQFTFVADHRHQLDEALKPVGENCLRQSLKLRTLLEDLRQHFHERGACLRVAVISQTYNTSHGTPQADWML